MARCVALALLAIIGGAAAGGYGAPDVPEPPPPAEPYGDEIIAVDPPPPPEPEPTEPPPPPPTEPPPPPPTEPPPPPPTEPPPPPPVEPPMPDPEPAGGYMEEPPPPPPEPEPTEPPPPPPTEPPPPPPTEPPPPPPPADEEPGYSDTMPMDTLIDDVELSEVATYGSVAPDGRKVLKKFKRTFKLAKPSIRDSLLAFRPASKCRNTQRLCEWWASQGECFGKNKRLMRSGTRGCGRACGVCTPNRQEWRLRRHNAGVLRRRLAAKGRKVVFKRRRAANN